MVDKFPRISKTMLRNYLPFAQLKRMIRILVLIGWVGLLVAMPIIAGTTFLLVVHEPDALNDIRKFIGWLLPLDDGNKEIIDNLSKALKPNAVFWNIPAIGFFLFAIWHAWLSYHSLQTRTMGRYSSEISKSLRLVILSAFFPILILLGVYLYALDNHLIDDRAIAFWYPTLLVIWTLLRFALPTVFVALFSGYSPNYRLRQCFDELAVINGAVESTRSWRIEPNSIPASTNGSDDWSPSQRMVRLGRRGETLRAEILASGEGYESHSLTGDQFATKVKSIEESIQEFLLEVSKFVEDINAEIRDENAILAKVTGHYSTSLETENNSVGNNPASGKEIYDGLN